MSTLSSCAVEFDDLCPGGDPLVKCQCEREVGGRFSSVSGGRSGGGLRVKEGEEEVSAGLTCWMATEGERKG